MCDLERRIENSSFQITLKSIMDRENFEKIFSIHNKTLCAYKIIFKMDDATLFNQWLIGLIIVAVIIVAAAVLLLLVWNAARRILRLATAALELVIQIKENTSSIWGLQQTNTVATQILEEAKEIEAHAGLVAEALD